jgi:aspartate aminotransferase
VNEFRLSRRARDLAPSATMRVDERLQALRRDGQDVIALGAGQPDFETPERGRKGGIEAIEKGLTRYTPVAGVPSLRSLIAQWLLRDSGLAVTAEQIVVSAGAKPALYHALLALVDPEDEVLIPLPAWPSYAEMVRLAGGRPRGVPTCAADGYKLTAESLVRALARRGGRPPLLLLNHPSNPTGAVYRREELSRLAEVIRGEDLFVVSDEIYEQLVYGVEFVSLATLPGMRQRTVKVSGFSKSFSMTGWRIGYATGPAPVMQAVQAVQSHALGNASSISQAAAEAALAAYLEDPAGREPLERMRSAFRRRRDLLTRLLHDIPGVRFPVPEGAFYFFLDVSAHYGKELGGRRVSGSREMAEYLLDAAQVGVVPGADFGDDGCIRISFTAAAEDLTVAVRRVARALGAPASGSDR